MACHTSRIQAHIKDRRELAGAGGVVDLCRGARVDDCTMEPPYVDRDRVCLDTPHVSGPTARQVPVQHRIFQPMRVTPFKADLVPTGHSDNTDPVQELDPPLELLEEDAVAESKRHATIHVAITRVAAHPSKILADLSCIRIILRPKWPA